MMVRKQFRETCKVQTRQYKALKAQILATTPKEDQKAVIKKLKEEQRRKLALLGDQYEQSIVEMLQKQCLRLDESQEVSTQINISKSHTSLFYRRSIYVVVPFKSEQNKLRERLNYELDILMAYQSKNKYNAQAQRDREREELEKRVAIRKSLLEQKVSANVGNVLG